MAKQKKTDIKLSFLPHVTTQIRAATTRPWPRVERGGCAAAGYAGSSEDLRSKNDELGYRIHVHI
ncbi:hypothetical protein E2C01_000414 [Portunus trituberculatus]|uniref:Uncharacterized protein n=1 Tax=Portunus trituberculatus TaxID=210409 RepID=A0A5B7CEL7_PORTR|nr:hypothetical protein [Portunus trituberculatus]